MMGRRMWRAIYFLLASMTLACSVPVAAEWSTVVTSATFSVYRSGPFRLRWGLRFRLPRGLRFDSPSRAGAPPHTVRRECLDPSDGVALVATRKK